MAQTDISKKIAFNEKMRDGLFESFVKINSHWKNKPNVTQLQMNKYLDIHSKFEHLIVSHQTTIDGLMNKINKTDEHE